jgi:ketosteroid isomerase-like protein
MSRWPAIAVLLAVAITPSAQTLPPALQAVVDTERAFARASVEHGQREAFLMYLADDGITFSPGPTPGKDAIRKRPPSANPKAILLNWAPMTGGVSSSGDLGFTTGPFVLEDRSGSGRPPQHGMYFTVWKKQSGGEFRAVLDLGIETNAPVAALDGLSFTPMARVGTGSGSRAKGGEGQERSLTAADAAFSSAAGARGLAAAAREHVRDDGRLHRNGRMPIVGRTAIDRYFGERRARFTGSGIFADASAAGDLGYTYGRYQLTFDDRSERGYYVRLWTRDGRGPWKVLIEVTSPAAAGQ